MSSIISRLINLAGNITGTLGLTNGGTGQTSAANAYKALSPMTTVGDMVYENATPTPTRLALGAANTVITSSTVPTWALIVNANIDAAAAIAGSKLQAATSGNTGTISMELNTDTTIAFSFAGGSSPAAPAVSYRRSGKVVSMTLSSVTTTAANATGACTAAAGSIPSQFRPAVDTSVYAYAISGGTAANSRLVIQADGGMTLLRDGVSTGFAGGAGGNGLNAACGAGWAVA